MFRQVFSAYAPQVARKRIVWAHPAGLGKKSMYFQESEMAGSFHDGRDWWYFNMVFSTRRLAPLSRAWPGVAGLRDGPVI